MLAAMIFAMNLPWTPVDHVELFAGKQSVTLGELQDTQAKNSTIYSLLISVLHNVTQSSFMKSLTFVVSCCFG